MNQQITDMISKCNTCNMYRNVQAREPLKSHELPGRPWQKIAVDLFVLDKQDYVVIVDYYSKFFEVSHLPNSNSKTVINHIKPHLARYGIPEIITSDNCNKLYTKFLFGNERERQALIQDGGLTTSPLFRTRL